MTPGRGFRWVRVGERLRETDQIKHYGGRWRRTKYAGWLCPEDNLYRRTRPHPARNKRKERG